MIKTVTTKISDSDLQAYAAGTTDKRAEIVQDVFKHLEESDLGELLGYFCTGDREVYNKDPDVVDVEIHDENSGTLYVDFTGSAYYGCKDKDRLDEHSEVVGFEVSLDDARIKFTTDPPDPVERSPDDEF